MDSLLVYLFTCLGPLPFLGHRPPRTVGQGYVLLICLFSATKNSWPGVCLTYLFIFCHQELLARGICLSCLLSATKNCWPGVYVCLAYFLPPRAVGQRCFLLAYFLPPRTFGQRYMSVLLAYFYHQEWFARSMSYLQSFCHQEQLARGICPSYLLAFCHQEQLARGICPSYLLTFCHQEQLAIGICPSYLLTFCHREQLFCHREQLARVLLASFLLLFPATVLLPPVCEHPEAQAGSG